MNKTKLKELKNKHQELRKEIQEESKKFFQEESAAIFEKYPKIEKFSFTGYTPYFNDGDECMYSVNSKPYINDLDSYENEDKDLEKAYEEIMELIDSIDNDTHKEMWGDHSEIIIYKNKIKVKEYSHD